MNPLINQSLSHVSQGKVIMFPSVQQEGEILGKRQNSKNVTHNKKKGKKAEAYPFHVEDMKKMMDYFYEKEQWIHYLFFVLSCNMARRASDTLSLKWAHFFNPATGNFRTNTLEIIETKTQKIADPKINTACKKAIELYIEKTGCDPSINHYNEFVFLQLSGTHKGKVITREACRLALKKAAAAIGIEYNVATHSTRKTFGKMNRVMHPGKNVLLLLKKVYNHRDLGTTEIYCGLEKEEIDQLYDDMGDLFDNYVTGNKTFNAPDNPVIQIDINDLFDAMVEAYEIGMENANTETDESTHIKSINEIFKRIVSLKK